MVSPLQQLIIWLEQAGFYDVVVPWAFIFAITYGILHTTKVFGVTKAGKPKTNINLGVALALSLFFIIAKTLVAGLNLFLSNLVIVIIVLLGMAMVFGFLKIPFKSSLVRWFTLALFLGLVVVTFNLFHFIVELTDILTSPVAFTIYLLLFVAFSTIKVYQKVHKNETPKVSAEEEQTQGKRTPKKIRDLNEYDLRGLGPKLR